MSSRVNMDGTMLIHFGRKSSSIRMILATSLTAPVRGPAAIPSNRSDEVTVTIVSPPSGYGRCPLKPYLPGAPSNLTSVAVIRK